MKRAKKHQYRTNNFSVSLLAQKVKKRFCVAVEEDMGSFGFIWFPPVKASDLEAYWSVQPAAGMDGLKQLLGGEWIGSDSVGIGRSGKDHFWYLWRRLHVPGQYYAHVCCDSDSYLQSPDGHLILHAGCDETFITNEVKEIESRYSAWQSGFFKGRRTKIMPGVVFPGFQGRRRKGFLRSIGLVY